MKKKIFLLVVFLMLPASQNAQTVVNEVFLKSWKTGEEKVDALSFQVKLDQKNLRFVKEISTVSGKQFLLRIDKESR